MAHVTKAMLVYQSGIANVFQVDSFNSSHFRNARRLWQGAFHSCEMFARGLAAAGVAVRTASCNVAGDCAGCDWVTGLAGTPFRDNAIAVNTTEDDGIIAR